MEKIKKNPLDEFFFVMKRLLEKNKVIRFI